MNRGGGGHDEVDHEAHQGPSTNDDNGALDLALLASLRRAQLVYNVGIFVLVVALDPGSKGIVVAARAQKRVGQGKGNEAGEGEDEDGEELGLGKRC